MKVRATSDGKICQIIGSVIAPGATREVLPSMHLHRDLGVDSVGLMTVVYLIEEHTGIDTFSNVDAFVSAEHVSDIIAIVRGAE
jgi:acyl carrier protein